MGYEEFKESFMNDLKAELSDRGMNVKVTGNRTEKLNQSYDAVCVTPEGSNVGVNANLDAMYQSYEEGRSYEEVIMRAADAVQNGLENIPQVDTSLLTDYSEMKDKLSMEVVSAERNAEMLKSIPHEQIEDMAVVYRLVLDTVDSGNGSILITNGLMEQFGVTQEQLRADAMENAPAIRPSEIRGMSEVLNGMMGESVVPLVDPADEKMFVATVPDKNYGAGVIAYPNFMEEAAEKLGGDYYLLPSSLHEVLLIKDNGEMDAKQLEAMVKDVNATQVAPEDRLTDHVYHYDSKEHIFEMADKFEARQAEKDAGEHDTEKDSVLKDLKEKKDLAKESFEWRVKEIPGKSKGGAEL